LWQLQTSDRLPLPCLHQGFRKYLNQATDHEELLAFILGQLVKEKALLYSNLHGEQAEQVSIKLSELNERVCCISTRIVFRRPLC
jgi:flagellar motor switch protein FliG